MSHTDHAPTGPDEDKRRVAPLAIAAVVVVLFLALVVFGIQLFSGAGVSPTSTAPTASPTSSSPSTPSPTPGTSAPAPVASLPPASPPNELTIESANINVPILPLTPTEADLASQSLVPPETLDGYWLTNYGTPGEGSDDTVYITGHSWEDRDSPFNRFSTDVEVGDTVTLTTAEGVIEYAVDSITTHNKDTLKDSDIWDIHPNRLVLISCYTQDLWGKNVVITAKPVL